MIDKKLFSKFGTTLAVAGMMFSAIAYPSLAATLLRNNASVEGVIRPNSPSFRFNNESRTGAPLQTAPGDEYVFSAQQGNIVQISVRPERSNRLTPVLVLFDRSGRQVAYNETQNSLRYQVPTTGQYRLLVLSRNNSRGRYNLTIAGLTEATTTGTTTSAQEADRVMRAQRLRIIGCGVPNVAKIQIGSEVRCTRSIDAGQYVYDQASQTIKEVDATTQNPSTQTPDQKKQFLRTEYGLTVLDNCPAARGSLVTVYFSEFGQTTTYCATPNRFLKAGEYTYNPANNELRPGSPSAQTTTPPTQNSDRAKQFLQNEYGLRVLDTCPTVRNSLVVAYVSEYGQTTTYCATPNRFLKAGEYTYNPVNNELRPGTPSAQTTTPTQTNDRRKEFLQNEYGLRVLDTCPTVRSSLVVAYFTEYGQTTTYCANPSRFLTAGDYTYDPRSNDLKPGRLTTSNPSTIKDERRDFLQSEYGLTVMDGCPASRTSLAVITFADTSGQAYTYCATPNRLVPAGEYVYNPNNNSLEVARKTQDCTISLGGVCLVK